MGSADVNESQASVAWGNELPDWVLLMAQACDRSSQAAVAKRLGVSSAMVNQALKRTYTGSYTTLEARVRGELMGKTHTCPVLGEITTRQCLDEQARGYAPTNPSRIAIFIACRRPCPHFKGKPK
ncbi:MAG: winged helix-turn-helix domain-containing protein [Burkholderiales bacterium]|nr:winged helix-turn-helix domain-containing protein [Burkholderiales bacterium]